VRALPKGAAIILRHRSTDERVKLAETLAAIARARGLCLLIAGDAELAARIGAGGLHLAEARLREAAHIRALHPSWLITAAAHSMRGVAQAARAGADAVLLAPVFPTSSHAERAGLGAARARFIAVDSPVPVYALGGVNAANVARLFGFTGIAAIEALIPIQSS